MFIQDLSAHARQYREPAHQLVEALEDYADRLDSTRRPPGPAAHRPVAADLLDALDSQRTASRSSAISPGRRWAARHSGLDAASAAPRRRPRVAAASWDNFNLDRWAERRAAKADAIMGRSRAAAPTTS